MAIKPPNLAALARGLVITAAVVAVAGWPAAASASSGWTVQPTPVLPIGGDLTAVSCTSGTSCTAVGYSKVGKRSAWTVALAESWDGSAWATQAVPIPGGTRSSGLFAVSCTSAASCTAVGYYMDASETQFALTEHWDGSAWAMQATPSPAGSTSSALYGVSCSAATSCTEVGRYNDASGNELTLAEHWDGNAWTVQATPSPDPSANILNAVSCPSAAECFAVGWHNANKPGTVGIIERWQSGVWRVQRTDISADALINDISCASASSCTAVGSMGGGGAGGMLADYWNGSAWTVQPVPGPAAANGQLGGVSCPSQAHCTAVGLATNTQGKLFVLAEVTSGGTWRAQAMARPPLSEAMSGISCTTAGGCTAVGGHTRGLTGQPLAEHR